MRALKYVGRSEIRDMATPNGVPVRSHAALLERLAQTGGEEQGWCTYVVSLEGELLLAPRRSEHVACAGGRDVLAAGELRLDARGVITEITNNSTGYCPPEGSWESVRRALDGAGIPYLPSDFTFVAHFRRCPSCGERNLVKDEWYFCAVCDAELPAAWNFGDA